MRGSHPGSLSRPGSPVRSHRPGSPVRDRHRKLVHWHRDQPYWRNLPFYYYNYPAYFPTNYGWGDGDGGWPGGGWGSDIDYYNVTVEAPAPAPTAVQTGALLVGDKCIDTTSENSNVQGGIFVGGTNCAQLAAAPTAQSTPAPTISFLPIVVALSIIGTLLLIMVLRR